jgi:polysaccharide export outer membrane protein
MALCRLQMTAQNPRRIRVALLLALFASAGCADLGQYVWVHEYREAKSPPSDNSYVLAAGDVISIRVYDQEAMSAKGKIRPDGKISLPFLKDVQAEGYTPPVLAEQLEARLKDYVNKPRVTVSVDDQRQLTIAIVGDVVKQGTVTVPPDSGVLMALATAGGLSDLAHRDRIFVVRNDPKPVRIRFKWEDLRHAIGEAASFRLRAGDTIVVE